MNLKFFFGLVSYLFVMMILVKLNAIKFAAFFDWPIQCFKCHLPNLENSFYFRKKKGKKLLQTFSSLNAHLETGILLQKISIPDYKFYSKLIFHLLELMRTDGIKIKKYLIQLKSALVIDLQFEEKIQGEISNGIFQFLMIMAATWVFVFLSQYLISIKIDHLVYFTMLFSQIFGMVFFVKMSHFLFNKDFSMFDEVFKEIYTFLALIEVGRPLNYAINESNVTIGNFAKKFFFHEFFEHFLFSLENLKKMGTSPRLDCELIIERIFNLQEQQFVKFHRKMNFIKFLHLAFIFLPSYFYYLHSIFKFFMAE
jgi:hypothetical protein